jgi:hypothetical protein
MTKAFRNHRNVWEKSKASDGHVQTYKMVLFYAVECGLKALYMSKNKLTRTNQENTFKESAAFFSHDLNKLLSKMNMDDFKVPKGLTNKKGQIEAKDLHEAWRYGSVFDKMKEDRCIENLKKILDEIKLKTALL